ncbi:peptidase [Fragilaria crotonensis]|nr:peptidase [Fragilaria crotonensis]
MSCHVLMKAAFLAALLLLVLKVSAEGQLPRLLDEVGDQTFVGGEQASKPDLDHGKPPDQQDTTSADGPLRQLDRRRPIPAHHSHAASTSARARSQHIPYKRHQKMKGTHPSQWISTSSRGRPRHASRMQHRMMKGTHPTQGTSTSARGQPRHAPHVREHMMRGSHQSQEGASTSFRGRSRHAPQVKKQMMQGGRHSSPRHGTPGAHKRMEGRHAGTRALTSADDQLRHLARDQKPRTVNGQHGPHVRASQNRVRSAMPRQDRLPRGVARPATTEGSRGGTRGNAQPLAKEKHHMMARNSGRQSHHGARTGGQGTLQHVLEADKPSDAGGTRGNAQPLAKKKHHMMARNSGRQSHHGARTGGQGTLQHVLQAGKPSHAGGGAHKASRSGAAHKRSTDSRIVGGLLADEGEFKFMTTIFVDYAGSLTFICGGSLIAPDIVLTAAHCGTSIVAGVRVGSNDLHSGGDMRSVVSQCLHPSYQALGPVTNDFMLLKLDSPIDTSEYPIVELNDDTAMPQVDDMLTVIGFGRTSTFSAPSESLLKVDVPVTSYDLCDQEYGGDLVEDIQFCAGFAEGGKSSCMGDSGGPILEMRGSTPVQVGVVSYGPEDCALPGTSVVYARVTGAYEWIQDTMAKLEGGDTSGCSGGTSSADDDEGVGSDDDDSGSLLGSEDDDSGDSDDDDGWDDDDDDDDEGDDGWDDDDEGDDGWDDDDDDDGWDDDDDDDEGDDGWDDDDDDGWDDDDDDDEGDDGWDDDDDDDDGWDDDDDDDEGDDGWDDDDDGWNDDDDDGWNDDDDDGWDDDDDDDGWYDDDDDWDLSDYY